MKIYRPSGLSRAMALAFFLVTAAVSAYILSALAAAEGNVFVLLLTVLIVPLLFFAAATLRMLTLFTRRIAVTPQALDHKQIFKNHHVPWAALSRVEAQRRADEEIGTLRFTWTGPRFYLDATSMDDWEGFLAELEPHLKATGGFTEVSSFEPAPEG